MKTENKRIKLDSGKLVGFNQLKPLPGERHAKMEHPMRSAKVMNGTKPGGPVT